MRTDHVHRLNNESTAYADLLAQTIETRKQELQDLERLHRVVLAIAEPDPGLTVVHQQHAAE